jgi:hypothetical protein
MTALFTALFRAIGRAIRTIHRAIAGHHRNSTNSEQNPGPMATSMP